MSGLPNRPALKAQIQNMRSFRKRGMERRLRFPAVSLSLVGLLLFIGAGAVPAGQPEIDVLDYDIAITLRQNENTIQGKTGIYFLARKAVRRIKLDFRGMQVRLATFQGEPVTFRQRNDKLHILLPQETTAGRRYEISIAYAGKPEDGLIIKKNKYGRFAVFADNWPNRASCWFPGIDHPADKASVRFAITAPQKYMVIANGRLKRLRDNLNGTSTTYYATDVAIPTYCMVFGAAEFDIYYAGQFDGIPISFWGFPEDMWDLQADFRRSGQMLQYFARRFGAFPFKKLAMVQSSTRFGGMENASAIFFSERSLGTAKSSEGTASHEIAHQWFGDWVTPRYWRDLWLSEGFATYFGMQFYEYADGADAFQEKLRQSREKYLQEKAWHAHAVVEETPEDLFTLLNPNTYTKGAWVLHMLRRLLGEDIFWHGIKKWVHTYQEKNVTTEQFRSMMEEVAGKPLDWFFEQWITRAGIPELQVTFYRDAAAQRLRMRIEQKQDGPPYRLPVKVRLAGSDQEDHVLWVHSKRKIFAFESPAERVIFIDPDCDLLARIEVTSGFVPETKAE